MVSAAHHFVLLQLIAVDERGEAGRVELQLHERRARGVRVADRAELLSLSGLHGFCG